MSILHRLLTPYHAISNAIRDSRSRRVQRKVPGALNATAYSHPSGTGMTARGNAKATGLHRDRVTRALYELRDEYESPRVTQMRYEDCWLITRAGREHLEGSK